MIKEGIYSDLSNDDYHNDKESISRSSIMDFKKSPKNYWALHLNPDRPVREVKASWEFGTAFHTLILEPDLFTKDYFILPEKVYLKDVGREAYEEYKKAEKEASETSKKVLSHADCQRLCSMQSALFSNERAKQLIYQGVYECSYFWKDQASDLMIKSRPDILNHNCYIDLKTCEDASPESYQRDMVKGGYHIQAAMVKDAVKILQGETLSACINICVEKKYPYSIGIYIIDDAAIEYGQAQYKSILLDMKSCIINNNFPDYATQTIGLPRWAL